MDPITSVAANGWLALATSPFGGAFVMGVVLGALSGIWLWEKYHVQPRILQEENSCTQRLNALQKELDEVKVIADKWSKFMERQAFAAMGINDNTNGR